MSADLAAFLDHATLPDRVYDALWRYKFFLTFIVAVLTCVILTLCCKNRKLARENKALKDALESIIITREYPKSGAA